MIDAKETLKKLHKEFPGLTLDDLFRILDCYTDKYPYWNGFTYTTDLQPKSFEVTCSDDTLKNYK